jgi:hypothetical protein
MLHELLQHIRTVHFLLLGLCLIVFASAPDASKTRMGDALEQAEWVDRIIRDPDVLYSQDPNSKIYSLLDGGVLKSRDSRVTAYLSMSEIRRSWGLLLRSASEDLVGDAAIASPWLICESGGCGNPKVFPKTYTIGDFRWLWNRGFLAIPDPRGTNGSVERKTTGDVPAPWRRQMPSPVTCSLEAKPGEVSGRGFFLYEMTLTCTSGVNQAKWVTQFNPPGYPVLVVPISEVFDPSSDKLRTLQEIPRDAIYGRVERFSHMFPDLAVVIRALPDLPVTEIVTNLKTRFEAEPERIDIFGAKVPISTVVPLLGFAAFCM